MEHLWGVVLLASGSPEQHWATPMVLCCLPLAHRWQPRALCCLPAADLNNSAYTSMGRCAVCLLLTDDRRWGYASLWYYYMFSTLCWEVLKHPLHIFYTSFVGLWYFPLLFIQLHSFLTQDIQVSRTDWFLKRKAHVFNTIWISYENTCIFTRITSFLKRRWLPLGKLWIRLDTHRIPDQAT